MLFQDKLEVMATSNEQDILRRLDGVLHTIQWKGPPSDTSHLNNPSHLASFKELGNHEELTSRRIISYALSHGQGVLGSNGTTLRICSIGCEDGSLDKVILEGLKERKVEYVGLETDETLCESTTEKLGMISSNIAVNTRVVDYEEDDLLELKLEAFDLIWMVNCTYYADQLGPLIQGATKLLKPSGVLLIISSSKQSIDQLITRFWSHQRPGHPLHTTETVLEVLSQLGLSHTVSREPVSFNLTSPLSENFQSPESLMLLDHLVFCRLSDYPPEVLQLVVEFLRTIAQTNGSQTTVSSVSDMIAIQH